MVTKILAIALAAQISALNGEIRDATSHNTIGSAVIELIRLDGTQETQLADGNGRFHFDSIEEGRYLSVVHAGYKAATVPLDRSTVGRIEIELVRRKEPREIPLTLSVREPHIPRNARKAFDQVQKDIKKGRLDQAEASALQAQERYHGVPEVHILLAKIYGQKKDEEKAVEQLRMYLTEAPDGTHSEEIRKVLGIQSNFKN
jgi:hypothetical protein